MPASAASIKVKEDLYEREEAAARNERKGDAVTCEQRHDETEKSSSQSSTDRGLYERPTMVHLSVSEEGEDVKNNNRNYCRRLLLFSASDS
jgi:hypothetical protein